MSQENAEIVLQAFEAFNSEDLGRIVALTHPDVLVEVPAEISAEPDTYRGHEGIRRYFESFQDAMHQIRFEAEEWWEAGDSVVIALRLRAKGKQTGIPVVQRTAGVWTIHDGKIHRIKAYPSTSRALEAAGLEREAKSQTPDVMQVWRSSFDAINVGDIDGAMTMWGPDPVFDLSPMGLGVYEGHAAIRGFWQDWIGTYQGLSIEPEETVQVSGGVTLAVIVQKGRPAGSSGDVRLRYAAIAIWVEGRTVRITNYGDVDAARTAAERLAQKRA